jgi:uncharacterized membrane protein
MKKFPRLLRHLFTTTAAGRRAFPPHTLKAIQAAIARGEKLHRAEVRLVIEPGLPIPEVLNGASSRERARDLFSHYRIWDTEENCGVLIYVNLADRKVEIVADRGVGRALGAGDWQAVCRTMTSGFAHGAFHDSVIAALEQLNALLQQHYPADGSTANELPNRPLII